MTQHRVGRLCITGNTCCLFFTLCLQDVGGETAVGARMILLKHDTATCLQNGEKTVRKGVLVRSNYTPDADMNTT